jgi:NAD(P)H-dependent flavin oxidoreductase YrpB (nitropropane dioxygenase family)
MVATTRYANMVRIACEEGIDAVISGAGLPLELPEITREYDVMIAPIVSGGRAAKTLLRMWKKRHDRLPDFIVVEGSQAGGHLGFSQEELESGTAQDLPIIVADVVREAAEAASWGGRRATGYGEAAESARFAAGEIPRSADALSSRAAAPSSAGETARSADALVSGPAAPAVADERGRLNEDGDHAAPAIPVFAAGSVFDGKDMAACKAAGARGVQIATRFIACRECDATQAFKDVILAARAEDVMILKSPVGMPGRGLATPLMQRVARGDGLPPKRCIRCIRTCDPATTPYCINRALIGAFYGNLEEGLFFCGGNVDRVTEMTTVHELMEELAREWRNR